MPPQDDTRLFGGRSFGCGPSGNLILLSESAALSESDEDRDEKMVRVRDIDQRTNRNGNNRNNADNMRAQAPSSQQQQVPYGLRPSASLLSLSSVAVAQQRLHHLQQLHRLQQHQQQQLPPPMLHPAAAQYMRTHHPQPHFYQPHPPVQTLQPLKKRHKGVYNEAMVSEQDPSLQAAMLQQQQLSPGMHPSRISSPPHPSLPLSKPKQLQQLKQQQPSLPEPASQQQEQQQNEQLQQGPMKWEVKYIPLLVSDQDWATGDETLREINLAEFINNKSARSNKKWKSDPTKRLYLPKEYSTNTPIYRRTIFAPVIARACAQAGFGITMKGWEKGLQAIRFVCNRNRKGGGGTASAATPAASVNAADEATPCCMPTTPESGKTLNTNAAASVLSDDKKKKRKRYVPPRIRPTASEEVCPFSFYVYWEAGQDGDETKGRWFIVNNGAGCCVHMGHPRKSPCEIRIKNDNSAATAATTQSSRSPTAKKSTKKQKRKRKQPAKDEDSIECDIPSRRTVPRVASVPSINRSKPDVCPKETSSTSTDSMVNDDVPKRDIPKTVNGHKRSNSLSDATTTSTATEEIGDDSLKNHRMENGSSVSEFPLSDSHLLNGQGQNGMNIMEPMTQQRRIEIQRRLEACNNGHHTVNNNGSQGGGEGEAAFELLLPLYKELTVLVATDPDRVQFAMAQLQDVVTQLRRHENNTSSVSTNGRRRSDASSGPPDVEAI